MVISAYLVYNIIDVYIVIGRGVKMDDNFTLLKKLSETSGISGYEQQVSQIISENFAPYCDEIKGDKMGNLMAVKRADKDSSNRAPRIMLAAHMDEIGLMVTKIEEKGFIRFTSVGGIDPRTLLAQEVVIHGLEDIPGIIGAKPPHLTNENDRKKSVEMEKMFIDPVLGKEDIDKKISVGDLISIKREFLSLHGDSAAGKAVDDRAGVLVLYQTLKELQQLKTKVDLYAVATVQEEVGIRGAITSTFNINPEIGIAIDVCHATMPGVDEEDAAEMGKGPAIGVGPHVHRSILQRLKETAVNYGIEHQIEPYPSPRGTDTWGIQVARTGVASGLISIPLRYMHTSVETLSLTDIKKAGQLLARFIASLDADFVEGLRCY